MTAHLADSNLRGRPAIGIDLGGTKIEALLLDAQGAAQWRQRVVTPAGDYRATLAAVAALVQQARALPGAAQASIGMAHPGTAAGDGRLKNANSVCLNDQHLGNDLRALLGQPLRLANDANCLALSEATDGAGAGAEVVFAVILGTGVGGGIAVRGQVLGGPNGLAGEWGHNPLPWGLADEPRPACYCGHRGCIETLLSGPALAADHARGSAADGSGGGAPMTAAQVALAAAHGDAPAQASLARWHERLARALAGVINLLDPQVIVLGGGLSLISNTYTEVPKLWARHVFGAGPEQPLNTLLRAAQHGDSSGIRGAAWLGAQAAWRGATSA